MYKITDIQVCVILHLYAQENRSIGKFLLNGELIEWYKPSCF